MANSKNERRVIVTPEIVGSFFKSSYSDQQGDCVEAAPIANGGCAVRDSKNLGCGTQLHASSAWGGFLKAIKDDSLSARSKTDGFRSRK